MPGKPLLSPATSAPTPAPLPTPPCPPSSRTSDHGRPTRFSNDAGSKHRLFHPWTRIRRRNGGRASGQHVPAARGRAGAVSSRRRLELESAQLPRCPTTCSVHAPGAHGDGGAAAEGSVARVTLGSQKGGPRSRGPGRGGGGGGTVWSGQKRHPGNGTGACGHHGSESFLFNPLPPPASPARAGRRTRVRRRRDRQTRGRWLLESAMTGADILQASSPHQEQAGGTARHLREAASARTSPSAAEEIGPRTR